MPETPTLLANVLSLVVICIAIVLGILGSCVPEAMIFCGLVMVCRNLNAVQMELIVLRQAMANKRARPTGVNTTESD